MTEQEKAEFWKTQQLFTARDIVRAANGMILLSPTAMKKIADEYQLTLPKGKIYPLREARDLILEAETKRRNGTLEATEEKSSTIQKPDTEVTKKEIPDATLKVVSYFRIVPASKKNDKMFLAHELNRLFSRTKPSEVVLGIDMAEEQGLITNAEELKKEYHNQLGLRAFAVNLEKFNESLKDEKELVSKLSGFMFNNYKHGYQYGQLQLALQKSSLSDEVKKGIIDRFYELLIPELEARYKNTKFRGSLLAKDILSHYDSFDMNRIYAILEISTEGLNIPLVRFESYRLEDEKFIKDILLEGSRKRLSAEDIAVNLKEFNSEYPMDFIIKTVRSMQSMGLVLPYDAIVNILANRQVKKDAAEEIEESVELTPVVHNKISLTEDGDFEHENAAAVAPPIVPKSTDIKPVSVGKKHKIIKREKAITAPDKKAVIAGLIMASGAISTAVLTSIFGVSPIEAAKNIAASIGSFTAGNVFLSQIIPATASLVTSLSAVGLATAGTVAWLRRRKAKQKEQRKQEILDVLEEVRREAEEAEKGGKVR